MSKEQMFYKLCSIMAELDDIIKTFEKLGFLVEPDSKDTVTYKFYNSASTAHDVATSLLEFPDVNTENDVFNELFAAGSDTMEEVSKRIWSQYGIK